MKYIIYFLVLLVLILAFTVMIKRQHYARQPGTCLYVRKALLNKQPKTEDQYIPKCTSFGAYVPQQCDEVRNTCWCVTPAGKKIIGTQTTGGEPPACRLGWFSKFYRQLQ